MKEDPIVDAVDAVEGDVIAEDDEDTKAIRDILPGQTVADRIWDAYLSKRERRMWALLNLFHEEGVDIKEIEMAADSMYRAKCKFDYLALGSSTYAQRYLGKTLEAKVKAAREADAAANRDREVIEIRSRHNPKRHVGSVEKWKTFLSDLTEIVYEKPYPAILGTAQTVHAKKLAGSVINVYVPTVEGIGRGAQASLDKIKTHFDKIVRHCIGRGVLINTYHD